MSSTSLDITDASTTTASISTVSSAPSTTPTTPSCSSPTPSKDEYRADDKPSPRAGFFFALYARIRRYSILIPSTMLAVESCWIRTDAVCMAGQQYCRTVVWLTLPVALAAFIFDLTIVICNYRAALGKHTFAVSLFLPGHLLLTFASGICLSLLIHEFYRRLPLSEKPVVVLVVLLTLLNLTSCNAFICGLCGLCWERGHVYQDNEV